MWLEKYFLRTGDVTLKTNTYEVCNLYSNNKSFLSFMSFIFQDLNFRLGLLKKENSPV